MVIDKNFFYILSLITIIFSLINPILLLFSSIFIFFGIIIEKSGNYFFFLLSNKRKKLIYSNSYYISDNPYILIKEFKNGFKAIGLIRVYNDKEGLEVSNFINSLNDDIDLIFKISRIDIDKIINEYDYKKYRYEIELKRTNDENKRNELKRKIEVINAEIENLSSTNKRFQINILIRVSSFSLSQFDAIKECYDKEKFVSSLVEGTLKAKCELLSSLDLLEVIA